VPVPFGQDLCLLIILHLNQGGFVAKHRKAFMVVLINWEDVFKESL
jgi:hypothetical protein